MSRLEKRRLRGVCINMCEYAIEVNEDGGDRLFPVVFCDSSFSSTAD